MAEHDDFKIIPSSGNAFADLGFDNPQELQTKAIIAEAVATIIAARRLTQAQAAGIFGVKQPDVSRLVNGRLMGFSLERLMEFVTALRHDIEISVKPHRGTGTGKVKVVVAAPRRRLAMAA